MINKQMHTFNTSKEVTYGRWGEVRNTAELVAHENKAWYEFTRPAGCDKTQKIVLKRTETDGDTWFYFQRNQSIVNIMKL